MSVNRSISNVEVQVQQSMSCQKEHFKVIRLVSSQFSVKPRLPWPSISTGVCERNNMSENMKGSTSLAVI